MFDIEELKEHIKKKAKQFQLDKRDVELVYLLLENFELHKNLVDTKKSNFDLKKLVKKIKD